MEPESKKRKTDEEIMNQRITEEDYNTDFLKDDPVVETHSSGILKSERVIRPAHSTDRQLMYKARTSNDTYFDDFYQRVYLEMRKGRSEQKYVAPIETPQDHSKCQCGKNIEEDDTDDSSSDSGDSDQTDNDSDCEEGEVSEKSQAKKEDVKRMNSFMKMEVERKRTHPNAVHPDISFNEKGLGNDGPDCRCSSMTKNAGLRHGYYAGEDKPLTCDRLTSNGDRLHHYFCYITPSPSDNQISKTSFMINNEEFIFEGFSILTHEPLPDCMSKTPISKWSLEYDFKIFEEKIPEGIFCPRDCDLLSKVIFHEIFEMQDFDLRPKHLEDRHETCPIVHLMPRFVTTRSDHYGLLSTKGVMAYIMTRFKEIFDEKETASLVEMDSHGFTRNTNRFKQNIVINTYCKPSSLRMDHFEVVDGKIHFVHQNVRPTAYSQVNLPRIQYLERRIQRHINGKEPLGAQYSEVRKELDEMKDQLKNQRLVRIGIPMDGYRATGFYPDMIVHVLITIMATHHVRYQLSINAFESKIGYKFNDRRIIELAMTHSSYKNYYGTLVDHAKTLISNCGYRRKYLHEERKEKKRGIFNLYSIMGSQQYDSNDIMTHNERLEYLGDSVVELVVTHHLFFMLTHHNEGGLATYRTALVQNRNLATLAKNIRIDEFLQFAHGVELCHEADFRHALANAFEALMAAVYLDGGLANADRVFSKALFGSNPELKNVWDHVNDHELRREDPMGDREMADSVPTLAKLKELEVQLGIEFNNLRVLAKALTRRSAPQNDLTRGHNQRLEWLGDSVLQLIVSDYLYKKYPYHHEGHLSLLRTSLVSNQTQSVICEDLGLLDFVPPSLYKNQIMRMKDKADLVESLIGALYVDRGIEHCRSFVRVCFLPRLAHFIDDEKWNDPKSHLQQWCLAMRDSSSSHISAIPEYKVIRAEGPTNSRIYKVAVYYKNRRLAVGEGQNVHNAELKAAENALSHYDSKAFQDFQDTKEKRKEERREKRKQIRNRGKSIKK